VLVLGRGDCIRAKGVDQVADQGGLAGEAKALDGDDMAVGMLARTACHSASPFDAAVGMAGADRSDGRNG
jgi:hypothetical protein